RFLHDGLHERLELFNYNPHSVTLTVRFTAGSDFRDMFSVRGFEVSDFHPTAVVKPIQVLPEGVLFGYHGHGALKRRTITAFDPPPEHVEIINASLRQVVRKEGPHLDQRDEGLLVPPMAAAAFELELPPMGARTIAISATPSLELPSSPSISYARPQTNGALDVAVSELRDSYADWCAAATQIQTNHQACDESLNRALLDLHLLVERYDDDLVPTAGIPWFAVPFGRDSLITSMQTLIVRPDLARGTLRFLGRHQGTRIDLDRGEEPGKILHEVRPGELGGLAGSIYYGSTDATPLF